MNKYLKEFISRVSGTHDIAKEANVVFFQNYFSQSRVVKKIFDGITVEDDIYAFMKKIDVKIDDLSVFQENEAKYFFKDLLFKVTPGNIRLYCRLNKTNDYTFSCIMENENIYRYVTHDEESLDVFFRTLMNNVAGKINEDPKFLLLLLYTPSFKEANIHFLISNMEDELIDYTDVFLLPKPYEKIVEINSDFDDSVCVELIRQNKLKRSWNNLIFSYRQIGIEKNEFFVKYVNSILTKNDEVLMQNTLHKKLKTDAKRFLYFLFFNENVQSSALDFFVIFINKNKVFFVPDIFFEVQDNEIEKEYQNWDFNKCITILNCFVGMRFLGFERYSLLICYLMKKNIYGILEHIDNLENGYNQLSRCICIYSSLLFHSVDYKNQKKVFVEDEISYILMKIDLDLLNIVFNEWKLSLGDNSVQFKFFVNDILSYQIVDDKIIESVAEKSLAFLNGLIGIAEPNWMEKIIQKIDKNGYLPDNLDKSSHIDRWRDSIYKYIGGMKDEIYRMNEKETIQMIWEKIPQIRSEMPNISIIANDYTQLEKVKYFREKVKRLFVQYESKKQYLTIDKRSKLEKLINCFDVFADRSVILCAKNKEMKLYEKAKNSEKIVECGKLITQLMDQCQKCLSSVPLLYAEVEKML